VSLDWDWVCSLKQTYYVQWDPSSP
jgi:hypothetical protein